MKTLQWMLAGVVVGFIAVAFRDFKRGKWLARALPGPAPSAEEPVLGYDGMDQETLLDWLENSDLDDGTVRKIIRYEDANLHREPVLETLGEFLS